MQWKALNELGYGPDYKVRRNTINVKANQLAVCHICREWESESVT